MNPLENERKTIYHITIVTESETCIIRGAISENYPRIHIFAKPCGFAYYTPSMVYCFQTTKNALHITIPSNRINHRMIQSIYAFMQSTSIYVFSKRTVKYNLKGEHLHVCKEPYHEQMGRFDLARVKSVSTHLPHGCITANFVYTI